MGKKNAKPSFDFAALSGLIDENKEKNRALGNEIKESSNVELEIKKELNSEAPTESKNELREAVISIKSEEITLQPDNDLMSTSNENSIQLNEETPKEEQASSVKRGRGRPPGSRPSVPAKKIGNSILDSIISVKDDKFQTTIYFDKNVLENIDLYAAAYNISRSEFVNLIVEKTMQSFPKLKD